jgi:hypothetical protein
MQLSPEHTLSFLGEESRADFTVVAPVSSSPENNGSKLSFEGNESDQFTIVPGPAENDKVNESQSGTQLQVRITGSGSDD